ncbi:hypothetical protein K437DRAFT_257530 [Tilletiaria anomala UBC 951]|uniref:ATP synthase F(0) complex subunit e, mitochondrial n=1 Tax=Tilletiaria anomala (strain ATCC 24038 / CBS 436.72 / UBC 951) TaxID=1037660 RepID=A0A066VSR9_TILAU|nr:uncharacterized protein K437DRAFT_257530 [Tilletiaria anomala UBC 951]KDN43323.1 hypothetical protein K437DRAFT_257530 [Tilletiaria anomala UBC 951]
MAPSPVINVVRYSALVGGIAYGIVHRRTLQAREDAKAAERAYKHKEDLIRQAKKAYADRLVAANSGSGVVTNPDDPKFDLEKFLVHLEKQL